jgi:hypothetical protein
VKSREPTAASPDLEHGPTAAVPVDFTSGSLANDRINLHQYTLKDTVQTLESTLSVADVANPAGP